MDTFTFLKRRVGGKNHLAHSIGTTDVIENGFDISVQNKEKQTKTCPVP